MSERDPWADVAFYVQVVALATLAMYALYIAGQRGDLFIVAVVAGLVLATARFVIERRRAVALEQRIDE